MHVRRDVHGHLQDKAIRAKGDYYVGAYCSRDRRPVPGCVCKQLCGDDGPSTPPLSGGGRASAAREAGDDDDSGMARDGDDQRIDFGAGLIG